MRTSRLPGERSKIIIRQTCRPHDVALGLRFEVLVLMHGHRDDLTRGSGPGIDVVTAVDPDQAPSSLREQLAHPTARDGLHRSSISLKASRKRSAEARS